MKTDIQILMTRFLLLLFLGIPAFLPLRLAAENQTGMDTNTVESVVSSLENRFDVSITIDAEAAKETIVKSKKSILNSKNISEALDKLVSGTDLKYKKLRSDYFVISRMKKERKGTVRDTLKPAVKKPPRIISGTVRFKSDGSPIVGANVYIVGTNRGTTTDINGHYHIQVSNGDRQLAFSYVGMRTVKVNIENKTQINVSLAEDTYGLNEVIVAGVAAKTPKKDLTISVTKVDDKQLNTSPSPSVVQSIEGKVAGVTVVQANGLPGSGAAIRLRGSTSLNGRQAPMIVLDGNILNTNLADINVDDVASVEVVKGAAASALYGSRAGNGVLVITTKRGLNQKAKTRVHVRSEWGMQEIAHYIDQATHHPYQLADDWQNYTDFTKYKGVVYDSLGNVIHGSRRVTDSGYADQPYARLINQQKEFYKKGFYSNNYVSVSGNEKKTNFLISYERNKQSGIIFNTGGYTRNNLRVNLDHHLLKNLKLSTSNLFIYTRSNNPASYKAFNDLLFVSPDVDLTAPNPDGSPYKIIPDPWSVAENPLYPLYYREKTSKRVSLIGNVIGDWYALPWLSAKVKYTYEYRNKYWNTYTPKGYLASGGQFINGSLYKQTYQEFNQDFQFTINMNKKYRNLLGKLKLSYLYENSSWNNYSVFAQDFIVAGVPQLNNTDPTKSQLNSYEGKIVAIDYFSILDLNWKDRYLFSGLFRMDGSSLFGANERWNPYYRLSAGYRISKDVHIPGIDEMKIRGAYGTSGLRPGFSYQYETWSINNGILKKSTLGNKDLKPSETAEWEVGLDMDFLKMFSFEATYSSDVTRDAFALAPLPSHLGYPAQWRNVGTLASTSIEASLNSRFFNKPHFSWSMNLTFSRIRQEVKALSIPAYNTGPRNAFFIKAGETFGIMYGYDWVRSLDVMAKQLPKGRTIDDYTINSDGYVILKGTEGTKAERPIKLDTNGDGLPDKVVIGNGNPDFLMSMSNTFKLWNFTVYFLFSWKNGGNIYDYTRQYTFRDNRAKIIDQYGKAPGTKKAINYYQTFYDGTGINSYFVEDGSFLKLRELSVSYSVNHTQLKRAHLGFLHSFNIGFRAKNLLTFTKYKGYDPEVASGGDLTNYPFDNFGYPNYRVITGSVSFTF
jgi:TonB-linked SusC/RagA family outer membrane protein